MVARDDLVEYLDTFLNCRIFDDSTVNGLQIEGKNKIERVVTGVSPSLRLFSTASRNLADAVILHHGLFWKRGTPAPFCLTGILKRRVAEIVRSDINLFAYHLPLDGNEILGNNKLIAQAIGLQDIHMIAEIGETFPLIAVGDLPVPLDFPSACQQIDASLGEQGFSIKLPERKIERIAVVSGAGGDCWRDAAAAGAQMLVTGEINEPHVREAEEAGISLYAGGHYNTEKWGIRALGEHLAQRFDLDVEFVDVPNPI